MRASLQRLATFAVSAVFVLLLASAASARPAPVYYFLKDGDGGPLLPGALDTVGPPPLYIPPTDPVNYTGGPLQWLQDVAANVSQQSAQTRLVLPAQDTVFPVQFVTTNATHNTGRIYGPILAFLVMPKTPLVQDADMVVELVSLTGASPPLYNGATVTVLASARVEVDGGNGTLPDPALFVPPNPADPQGAAAHVAGQLLLYGITKLQEGYYLLFLDDDVPDYIIDVEVPLDALLALRLRLLAPDGSSLPIPTAVGQAVVYNTTLTPDLVYVPWYAPDPATPPSPPPTSPPTTPPPTTPPAPPPPPADEPKKDSPGPGFIALLGIVALALLLRRR